MIHLINSRWMGICLGGSEVKLDNRLPLAVQGSDLGRVGNLWVRNLLRSNKTSGHRIKGRKLRHSRELFLLSKRRNRMRFCWQL